MGGAGPAPFTHEPSKDARFLSGYLLSFHMVGNSIFLQVEEITKPLHPSTSTTRAQTTSTVHVDFADLRGGRPLSLSCGLSILCRKVVHFLGVNEILALGDLELPGLFNDGKDVDRFVGE